MGLPSLAVVQMAANKHSFVTCCNFKALALVCASAKAVKQSVENRVKTMECRDVVVRLVLESGGDGNAFHTENDRCRAIVVGGRDPPNRPSNAKTNIARLLLLSFCNGLSMWYMSSKETRTRSHTVLQIVRLFSGTFAIFFVLMLLSLLWLLLLLKRRTCCY